VGGVSGGCRESWLCKVAVADPGKGNDDVRPWGLPASGAGPTPDAPRYAARSAQVWRRCVASSRDAGEHDPRSSLGAAHVLRCLVEAVPWAASDGGRPVGIAPSAGARRYGGEQRAGKRRGQSWRYGPFSGR
jgi:hypothetical protein